MSDGWTMFLLIYVSGFLVTFADVLEEDVGDDIRRITWATFFSALVQGILWWLTWWVCFLTRNRRLKKNGDV